MGKALIGSGYSGQSGLAAVAFLVLAGCGSSGSDAPPVMMAPPPQMTPAPAPAPQPAPPPPPEPTIPADGPEFSRNSQVFNLIDALPAYEEGIFGEGSLVVVIDTGIDPDSPEFEGRLDPASADLLIPSVVGSSSARVGGPDLSDSDDHGNSVAAIIGAARNDIGVHGVAPEADLLVFRADDDSDAELQILGSAIREGIIRSVAEGAGVLNLSLGSNEPGARASFRQLLSIAADGDIVTVIAAGNDGGASPESSALAATDPAAGGATIIAGSVTRTGDISSFSNRAGTAQNFFLTAPGELIRVPDNDGSESLEFFSGTSAATPVIAGAAALVRSVWPTLSATEVVDILLSSATDLGAVGVDEIFGAGLLNIERALQPSGAISTGSQSGAVVGLSASPVQITSAFGSSFSGDASLVFLDQFGRDFSANISSTPGWSTDGSARLLNLMPVGLETRSHSSAIDGRTLSFRLEQRDPTLTSPQASLLSNDSDSAAFREDLLRIAVSQPIGSSSLTFAQGFSAREIADRSGVMPFDGTMGRVSLTQAGFDDPYLALGASDVAASFATGLGRFRLSAFASYTDFNDDPFLDPVVGTALVNRNDAYNVTNSRLSLHRHLAGNDLSWSIGARTEQGGIFGARFGGAIGGIDQSATVYQNVRGDFSMFGEWRAFASASLGVSDVTIAGDGLATQFDSLVSTQFALSVYRSSAFIDGDAIAFSLSQPLWVESGGVDLTTPVAFDASLQEFSFADQRLNFGGGARPIDAEIAYRLFGTSYGSFEAGVLHQWNALTDVNGASANSVSALVRYSNQF